MAVERLDALTAKLESMKGNAVSAVKRGVGYGLKRIQAGAKAKCAVDTGRLRASIVTDLQTDGTTVTGTVGTNVEYAPYVEFGTGQEGDETVAHTAKKSWTYCSGGKFYTTSGTAPRPFLFPAYRENEEQVKQDIRNAVADEIMKRGG